MRVFLAFLFLCGLSTEARADWLRAESPNFIVFSEGSESRLRARATELEDFDALLRLMLGIGDAPPANKLRLYIVSGHRDLETIRPVGEHVDGFYTATAYGVAAFADGRSEATGNSVLFHEYAHHFMMQHASTAYPVWYIEGFAEYFMTARFVGRVSNIGLSDQGRAWSLVQGEWLPMERVLFGDLEGLSRDEVARFYAQSWLTTHYFFSTPERQQALLRFLSGMRTDNSEATLQATTGMTARALGEALRRYIRDGRIEYRRLQREAESAPPPITVTPLPAAADDLMIHHAALSIGPSREGDEARLAAVRAAAARHPGDPFAQRILAEAEILLGDPAAAEPLLEGLLTAAPNDADLLYLRGMRHLAAAEKGDDWDAQSQVARRWFTRAHRADDNHFQTLYRFAQSLRGEPAYLSENTSNVLMLANQLAPQVAEIRMNTAAMLVSRGEIDLAEEMLRPLAGDPHNAELAEAARGMIREARAHAPSAAAAPATGEE